MKKNQSLMIAVLVTTLLVVGVAFELSVTTAAVNAAEAPVGYNPAKTYSGPWGSKFLYYRNRNSAQWLRGLKGNLSTVTCTDAYNSLSGTGRWQGHLQPSGACGPLAEPSSWALGNYLNFLSSSAQ